MSFRPTLWEAASANALVHSAKPERRFIMPMQNRDANRWLLRAGEIDRRSLTPLLGAGAAFLMLAGKAQAQQVPIPTTAAQVPGPPTGTAMTAAYVQSAGRTAYLWGTASTARSAISRRWPMVTIWRTAS
jgi:hypothetical protein